ncbi:MAG TPA: helix-turn-helix domain-containing protein [Trueperaceae bacterium]|nr:helix-turn-helix domain-containing protein [Trueperaceae bacterium]
MPSDVRDTIELSDPRALRALAHPTRLVLVGLLRREGPLTATAAGERIGQSPASCSFHLRQLAKWGLVEEAGGGRGRERPWRATARTTSWKVTDPAQAEPSAALGAIIVQHQMQRVLEAVRRQPGESAAWQRAHQLSDTQMLLTPEQLEDLGARVWQVVKSYEPRSREEADARAASEGARRVDLFFAAFPEAAEER